MRERTPWWVFPYRTPRCGGSALVFRKDKALSRSRLLHYIAVNVNQYVSGGGAVVSFKQRSYFSMRLAFLPPLLTAHQRCRRHSAKGSRKIQKHSSYWTERYIPRKC